MPTLTIGSTVLRPLAVLDYSARRRTGTIVQQRVSHNQPSPDVTLRAASLRSGTLSLLFADGASAQLAFDTLAGGVVFVFAHEGRPEWAMTAVPGEGDLAITIQDGAQQFIVSIPFQEVTP